VTRTRLLLILVVALLSTALSGAYQRYGPIRQVEGEGFCPGVELCFISVEGAGFPLPFLIDDPQYTVRGKLSLADDEFRVEIFALDFLIYALLFAVAAHLLDRGVVHRRESAPIFESPSFPPS